MSYTMKLFNSKHTRNVIERWKGFIVGASEDGTLYTRVSKNAYILEVEQNNQKWLETFQNALKIAYQKASKIDKKKSGYFRLSCYSKQLYKELLEMRNDLKTILNESTDFKIGFLQGFFDAEGSVHNLRLSIRVCSKNKQLILVAKELLKEFGITTGKIHVDTRTHVLTLPIYGKENLSKFQQRINFNHDHKEYRLSNLL